MPIRTMAATVLALAALANIAHGAERLRLIVPYPPDSLVAQAATRLGEQLAGNTGGELVVDRVDAVPAAPEAVHMVRMRAADLGIVPTPLLAETVAPAFAVLDLPFLFDDPAAFERVGQSALGRTLLGRLAEEGIVGLDYWSLGMTRIGVREDRPPIRDAASLRGLRLASFVSAPGRRVLAELGTAADRPVPLEAALAALAGGAIDAVELSPMAWRLVLERLPRLDLTGTGVRPVSATFIANLDLWRALPYRLQVRLAGTVQGVGRELAAAALEQEQSMLAAARERGFGAEAIPAAGLAGIRETAMPGWVAALGGDTALLDAARAASRDPAAAPAPPAPQPTAPPPQRGETAATILYATDRRDEGGPITTRFGTERTSGLSFGRIEPVVRLDQPGAGPGHYAVDLPEPTDLTADQFFAALAGQEPLVLVHGFNNSFADAVSRAAIARRAWRIPGPVVAYSWPATGGTIASWWQGIKHTIQLPALYATDRRMATDPATPAHFASLLGRLAAGGGRIDLASHSMGGEVVLGALRSLALPVGRAKPLKHLVFAAPDVDRSDFSAALPLVDAAAAGPTLYASVCDWAMSASRLENRTVRAGMGGPDLLDATGIDIIDASQADTELRVDPPAHAYLFTSTSMLVDLHEMLVEDKPPPQRILLNPVPAQPPRLHPFFALTGVGAPGCP